VLTEAEATTLLPLDDVLGCSAPRAFSSSRAVLCTAARSVSLACQRG
jgi:hypothetical protein